MSIDEEKDVGNHNTSESTLMPNARLEHEEGPFPDRVEGDKLKLLLTEKEALMRARETPNDELPIYLSFSVDDRDNPRNLPTWKRWYICCFASSMNVLTCWCAGSISSGAEQIQQEFDVSSEVTTLCLSMYILGLALGPMLLAPLSEHFGRRNIYIVSWFCLFMFQLPLALAPNIATIIVCRFITGCAGSAPLTNTGGSISDLFKRNESGAIMAVYGLSSTFGPFSALPFSGYIAQNLGWRYLFWILMAITGTWWVLLVLTVPETRHTLVLLKKTQRVRKQMQMEGLATAKSIKDANADLHTTIGSIVHKTLTRPLHFLFTEPITIFAALYNGFLYGVVYLYNESFPLVFSKERGFSIGEQGLAFLGLAIGPCIAFCFYPLQERYYLSRIAANDGKGVPEARVWMARWGAFLIPISLFWFAWTSYSSIHWIVPIIASGFFGAGIYIIILSILNYVVDAYQTYAASALAGIILIRNIVGAGFPLFAEQMYEKLGNEWASTLLAFLALLLVPVPFILFYKGEAIRLRSPWAREHFDQDEDVPH